MVDSINTSSASILLSPPAPHRSDAVDSTKTDDLKGDTLSNKATLSAPKPDSPQSHEPCEQDTAVENKPVHQISESTRNEHPGSTIDVLT